MSALAPFVLNRAQRSLYLISSLRQALGDLGRPDLIAILDLIHQDASQAQEASKHEMALKARGLQSRILVDLKSLAKAAGPAAQPLAVRIARRLAI